MSPWPEEYTPSPANVAASPSLTHRGEACSSYDRYQQSLVDFRVLKLQSNKIISVWKKGYSIENIFAFTINRRISMYIPAIFH
ncbi:MAG: hypothetical protein ABI663_11405 [Chryseolinea sp.]